MDGKNENGRVTSPENLKIHLKVFQITLNMRTPSQSNDYHTKAILNFNESDDMSDRQTVYILISLFIDSLNWVYSILRHFCFKIYAHWADNVETLLKQCCFNAMALNQH